MDIEHKTNGVVMMYKGVQKKTGFKCKYKGLKWLVPCLLAVSLTACGDLTKQQAEEVKMFNENTAVTIDCYETNTKVAEEVNEDLIAYLTKGVISDELYAKMDLNTNTNEYLKEQNKGNKQTNDLFDERYNECQILLTQGYDDKFYKLYDKYLKGDFEYYNQNKSWYFDAYSIYADVMTTGLGASTMQELIVINGMQEVSMKVKVYWYNGKIQSINRVLNNVEV